MRGSFYSELRALSVETELPSWRRGTELHPKSAQDRKSLWLVSRALFKRYFFRADLRRVQSVLFCIRSLHPVCSVQVFSLGFPVVALSYRNGSLGM